MKRQLLLVIISAIICEKVFAQFYELEGDRPTHLQ